MFKNGIVKALAVLAVLGAAACNQSQEEPAVADAPAAEIAAPAPETTPVLSDTLAVPAADTQLEQGDVEAPATQPGY